MTSVWLEFERALGVFRPMRAAVLRALDAVTGAVSLAPIYVGRTTGALPTTPPEAA